MDVAEWLRELGLEEYEPAFRANAIDARVLPSLTAEDLKDLGVTLVGHRRRLLGAIAVLGAGMPAAGVTPAPPPLRRYRPRPNGGSSPSCFATASARPRCRPVMTRRICGS
jgi:hypothetical protein